ncbi:acyltransferase family protein [Mesorhizobium marinum]|uniref:acyltransferase family protein n=1 Tax=Mesorhizobium marinum TaxID=3228790 RepID=UPI00346784D9
MTVAGAPDAEGQAASGRACARRYDLDWLRVFAFGLLIAYHVGLFYVTWDWLLKSRYSSPFLEPALGMIDPWRLALLFFISGAAIRFALDRSSRWRFLGLRLARLFPAFAFGIAVVCVPQSYASLRYWGEIPPGFLDFCRDYFGFGRYAFALPDWHHLWYLAYLMTYTAATVLCLPILRYATVNVGAPLFRWLAAGRAWRLLLVPVLPFCVYTLWLSPYFPKTNHLWGDWTTIARTFTVFVIGFMAAGNGDFWAAVDRALQSAVAASIALGALLLAAWLNSFEVGADLGLLYSVLVLKDFYAWSVIVMLLGLARRFANRPSRALTYLTAAVLPYYILHQTIIVVVGYWFTLHEAPLVVEAASIAAATVIGCVVGYEVVRRAGPVRLLFGLPLRERRAGQAPALRPAPIPSAE